MQETGNGRPLWHDTHPTAHRPKGYIDDVLGYAMARRWPEPGINCGIWKDNLEHLLADPKAIHKPEPHASLHFEEIAGLMGVLRMIDGMEFRCLGPMT